MTNFFYAKIVAEYEAGASTYKLSHKYGIPRTTLRTLLINYGATMRGEQKGPQKPEQLATALKLYQETNLPLIKITEQTGIAIPTIYRYLRKNKIPYRYEVKLPEEN